MSALTVVQTVCQRLGLQKPNVAVSSSDPQILQILSILNEEGQALSARYTWQTLTKEVLLTTVNAESQGDITDIAPGLKFIVNDTIWDRTLIRPVFGPQSNQRWQLLKARNFAGPYSQFRIRGNQLIASPAPPAGHTWAFEYVTKNWVSDVNDTTSRSEFVEDDDYPILDEQLLILGTMWRWLSYKGFEYAERFAEYERQVADAIGRDGSRQVLHTAGEVPIGPGVIVPEGSWTVG